MFFKEQSPRQIITIITNVTIISIITIITNITTMITIFRIIGLLGTGCGCTSHALQHAAGSLLRLWGSRPRVFGCTE